MNCPNCGYPNCFDGVSYKGIYTQGKPCSHCKTFAPDVRSCDEWNEFDNVGPSIKQALKSDKETSIVFNDELKDIYSAFNDTYLKLDKFSTQLEAVYLKDKKEASIDNLSDERVNISYSILKRIKTIMSEMKSENIL